MCGCLIGTLPQVPQQNVFLGLPLELMIEEAALLLEKGMPQDTLQLGPSILKADFWL